MEVISTQEVTSYNVKANKGSAGVDGVEYL